MASTSQDATTIPNNTTRRDWDWQDGDCSDGFGTPPNRCESENCRSEERVAVQVLCSYITLPLYALVTQMGSQFKSKVLEEKIANIIKQWHAEVRVKRKKQEQCSLLMFPRTSLSTPDWSLRNSPTDFSSHHHHRPTSTTPIPTDQTNKNNFSNRGEITEEKVDTPDDHRAPDSTWLPYQAGVVELPTVRQDKGN
ncbi:hypothetical protein TEA_008600 [Camellia sinensis var. sinensis]|uniref:MLO-like protein n=1 Tax=Camellia sinensis var. sinensis TaxID=542762 RepID=A0A4S4F281_CAMSN|nr:hypothetical protein TEA_008600 [Camellia sinensis var. sinensis]